MVRSSLRRVATRARSFVRGRLEAAFRGTDRDPAAIRDEAEALRAQVATLEARMEEVLQQLDAVVDALEQRREDP